jgi:hypothetical protein
MIYPTIKATVNSIKIAENLYPGIHHINNKANAFRHALWNVLLAMEMLKWNKNISKSIVWAKKVSDWHEKFSPNPLLEKEMDLHNNKMGRVFFEIHYKNNNLLTKDESVEIIRKEALKSNKISAVCEINNFKESLVYIYD